MGLYEVTTSLLTSTLPASQSQPGVTTDEIDQAVHQMIIEHGAYPSPLRYGMQSHLHEASCPCLQSVDVHVMMPWSEM
jgi:methionine aminopeptidase